MDIKNKIVVIGGDHHNTLGIIESFGEKGIKSYAIIITSRKHSYVCRSKYVADGWCCHEDKEVVECLLRNFTDKTDKAVAFTTSDHAACILDENYASLCEILHIPTTLPHGNLAEWMSKEKMSALAKEVGLNVPETWLVTNNALPSGIEYPVITKAISSVAGTKANIKICQNKSELFNFLQNQKHCPEIQVQRFIDKAFEFQLLGCSINHGEDIIIPGRTHIDRPNGLDNTFFLSFDKCEHQLSPLIEKTKEFIRRTGYSGLFSVEFLRDKNGNDFFTEMNFRNDGNAICVTAAGTNIPYIYYLATIGQDYKTEIKNSEVKKIYLMPEFYYFQRLLAGEISIKEWIRNVRKTNCYTTYFKNDKKPFVYFLAQKVHRIFEKIF